MTTRHTILLLLCTLLLTAAIPNTRPQRIKFARGRTTAAMKGSVTERKGKMYVLGARAGQTMAVHVASKDGTVQFTIATPEPDILTDPTDDFSGELPVSGDYQIALFTNESKPQPYTLEVTIR